MPEFEISPHVRHSIRLPKYDYSQAGEYFITICLQNRECLFGEIVNDEMILNDAGRMVSDIWHRIPGHNPGVEIDEFVVMPNHIHGIMVLVGADHCVCPINPGRCQTDRICSTNPGVSPGQSRGIAPTLPQIVQRFKTLTTKRYIDGVNQKGWQYFQTRLWQRNYYEHVIRNEDDLNRIKEYISTNQLRWASDTENPDNLK